MEFQSYKQERKTYLTFVRPYSLRCLGTTHSLNFSTFFSPFLEMFRKRNDNTGLATPTVTCVCVTKPDCLHYPEMALFCIETKSVVTNHYSLRNKLSQQIFTFWLQKGKQRTLSILQNFSDISHRI